MNKTRKEYMLEYQRKWLANRRHQFFYGKLCVNCGSNENLELDHIDPSTKDPTLRKGTRIWSWSKERREIEIAKCQVLCETCHLEKTKKWYSDRRNHGTRAMYSHGCRCRNCKTAEVSAVNSARKLRVAKRKLIISDSSNGRTVDSGSTNQCSSH